MAADLWTLSRWECDEECAFPLLGDGGDDGEVLSEKYALVETDLPAAGFAFAGEGVDGCDDIATYRTDKHSGGFSRGVYSGGVSALFYISYD